MHGYIQFGDQEDVRVGEVRMDIWAGANGLQVLPVPGELRQDKARHGHEGAADIGACMLGIS